MGDVLLAPPCVTTKSVEGRVEVVEDGQPYEAIWLRRGDTECVYQPRYYLPSVGVGDVLVE